MKDHGTRTRYVTGCRCDFCREANRRYAAERGRRARELAALVILPTESAQRMWHVRTKGPPLGEIEHQLVTFKRMCPGVDAKGCKKGAYLTKNSVGSICSYCREHVLSAHTMVPADQTKHNLFILRTKYKMGTRSVAYMTDISRNTLQKLKKRGKRCDRDIAAEVEELLEQERKFDAKNLWARQELLAERLPATISQLKEHFIDRYQGVAGERMLYRDLEALKASPNEDGKWRLHDAGVGKEVGHRESRLGSPLPVL
jgi:hypothetical protein